MTTATQTARRPLPTWRYLTHMWRYAPWICLLHGLLWDVMNLSSLVPGVIVGTALDTLTGDADPPGGFSLLIVLLVAFALGKSVLWLAGGYVEIRMRFLMGNLLRINLLRHLLTRAGALPLPYPLGETISRFRDDAYSAEDVMDWTDEIIVHTLIAIGALVMLARIDLAITVVVTIPLILISAITQWASARLTRLREASSQATSEVTGAIGSLLAATTALQAANAEGRSLARIAALNERRRSAMVRDAVAATTIRAIAGSVSGIATGIVMLMAASQLRDGSMTIGDFAMFVLWVGMVADLTVDLGHYLTFYRHGAVAFHRMDAMLEDAPPLTLVAHTPLEAPDDAPTVTPTRDPLRTLDVTGLTYHHPGDANHGVTNVSLHLDRGSLTVVTGRVGSGKTTLLRTLLGLLPAQAGEIRWNGGLTTSLTPPHAAYIPQVPRLFSETLRTNILLGEPDDPEAIRSALAMAVLETDIATFPLGLETEVGTRGLRLSGGQIQRTAAARMFVRDAELLVIDDLSSALDVETERLLWDRLRARGDVTILAVAHRRVALERADRIVLMEDGRVVAEGSLRDLLATQPLMRELWSMPEDDRTT